MTKDDFASVGRTVIPNWYHCDVCGRNVPRGGHTCWAGASDSRPLPKLMMTNAQLDTVLAAARAEGYEQGQREMRTRIAQHLFNNGLIGASIAVKDVPIRPWQEKQHE